MIDSLQHELRITEIFFSLQGEARTVGMPTVFIRLTGCPLRCTYCDTTYSFTGGEKFTLADILAKVAHYGARDPRVSKVLDLKTPDSGESHRNLYDNIQHLTTHDQVKFVICSRRDYDWARFKVDEYQLPQRVSDVLFSPSHEQQQPRELAEWLLADKLQVRLQLQLHKYLWNNESGH